MMTKIPDNSSAERLQRLMSRNLGTDFSNIKGKNKSGSTAANEPNHVEQSNKSSVSNSTQVSNTIKHQQLAAQSGTINTNNNYSQKSLNIHQRAQKRKQLELARKQQNVETIMSLALEYCSESANEEEIDPDWFHQFIQLSENTSSKMMQALWGKILAGEIANPGTFSFKSLTILKRMTNKEAIAFQHACQLAMTKRKDNSAQITYGYYQKPSLLNLFALGKKHHINLGKLSLPYPELLMLMDIELIYHTEIESGEIAKGETIEYSYLGKSLKFTAHKGGTVMNYFKFTQTGYELAKLIRLTPDKKYINELENCFSPAFDIEL